MSLAEFRRQNPGSRFPSVGFTGTRRRVTDKQEVQTRRLVALFRPTAVHHGCCIGGDEMFHRVCEPFEMVRWLHRPYNQQYVANLNIIPERDMICPPLAYEDRNEEIVGCSDSLIATPKEFKEVIRSGTWMTVRMARRARIPIYIIWPNGDIRYEGVAVEDRLGNLFT